MEMRGTLQGGLPERPLRRDAFFGLSYHNTNGTRFYEDHEGDPTHEMRFHSKEKRVAGMVVHKGAKLRVFTPEVTQATMVICWNGLDAKEWEVDYCMKRAGEEERTALARKLDTLPKKIAVVFGPNTSVQGVRFDDVVRSGLRLVDPSLRSNWKDVLYGPDCDGPVEELFAPMEGYHWRNRTY
jgi:hypothetical protein